MGDLPNRLAGTVPAGVRGHLDVLSRAGRHLPIQRVRHYARSDMGDRPRCGNAQGRWRTLISLLIGGGRRS